MNQKEITKERLNEGLVEINHIANREVEIKDNNYIFIYFVLAMLVVLLIFRLKKKKVV